MQPEFFSPSNMAKVGTRKAQGILEISTYINTYISHAETTPIEIPIPYRYYDYLVYEKVLEEILRLYIEAGWYHSYVKQVDACPTIVLANKPVVHTQNKVKKSWFWRFLDGMTGIPND